jgi:uncharacterized membrane protein YfcA
VAASGVAALGFALFAPVRWLLVVPLAAGFLVGGWSGPKLVRRIPAQALRMVVAIAGVARSSWISARTGSRPVHASARAIAIQQKSTQR